MILFTNLTSPYARLARIAVIEKGLADRVEVRVIDPWGGFCNPTPMNGCRR